MRWTHFQALGLALAIMASLLEPASSLSTKLWCPRLNCYSYIVTGVTADILAVDNYAASNNRQRVTFNGTIAFNNLTNQLGTFDMLLVYTWRSGTQGRIFSGAEQAAVASALASGSLKKLMVWHAWNKYGDNGVPGVVGAQCGDWQELNLNYTAYQNILANSTLYATVGPNPPSSAAPLNGNFASHGGCPAAAVTTLDRERTHTVIKDLPQIISAFSFCYAGRGAVFYSQTPMDAYLIFKYQQNYVTTLTQFHANAISVFTNDITCSGPPRCPVDVVVSRAWLPPNKKMTAINITTVPIQDPVYPGTVKITNITFYDSQKGQGDSVTFPLAAWPTGTNSSDATVLLRAERNGSGRGRLYRISYTASNALGSCSGKAYVCIPHDASAFDPPTADELAAARTNKTTAVGSRKVTCPQPSAIPSLAWKPTRL